MPLRFIKARALLAAGFFVCGIAGAADLSKLTLLQLCAKVRRGDQAALDQLVSRNKYPVSETAFIARGEIFVGMTEGSAVCALGPAETVNTTHTSSGVSLQAVYPEGRKIRYVYVDNGIVTSWQE